MDLLLDHKSGSIICRLADRAKSLPPLPHASFPYDSLAPQLLKCRKSYRSACQTPHQAPLTIDLQLWDVITNHVRIDVGTPRIYGTLWLSKLDMITF